MSEHMEAEALDRIAVQVERPTLPIGAMTLALIAAGRKSSSTIIDPVRGFRPLSL